MICQLHFDCAASELFSKDSYKLTGENKKFSSDEMVFYMQSLVDKYEIKSVEDPFDEKDWDAWKNFYKK